MCERDPSRATDRKEPYVGSQKPFWKWLLIAFCACVGLFCMAHGERLMEGGVGREMGMMFFGFGLATFFYLMKLALDSVAGRGRS